MGAPTHSCFTLLALVAYSCSSFDAALANVVVETPSGQVGPQTGFKAGFCYANFESGSNKVESYFKYECITGSTITKTHYSDASCSRLCCVQTLAELNCKETFADGETVGATVYNCKEGTPDVAVGLIEWDTDTCQFNAKTGCGIVTSPNLIEHCLGGFDYWDPYTAAQVSGSSGSSKMVKEAITVAGTKKITVYVYDSTDCTGNPRTDKRATYRYAESDSDRAINCMAPGWETDYQIPKCNAVTESGSDVAGSWLLTTETVAMQKAGLDIDDSGYVCISGSGDESSSSSSSSVIIIIVSSVAGGLVIALLVVAWRNRQTGPAGDGQNRVSHSTGLYSSHQGAAQGGVKVDNNTQRHGNEEALIASKACDIFVSLRFKEKGPPAWSPRKHAEQVKKVLKKYGLDCYICSVDSGASIVQDIVHNLSGCKMALIIGSETYGNSGTTNFTTEKELKFITDKAHGKPFFLIKMCKAFKEPIAKMYLSSDIAYEEWEPNTPMPSGLAESIVEKFRKIK